MLRKVQKYALAKPGAYSDEKVGSQLIGEWVQQLSERTIAPDTLKKQYADIPATDRAIIAQALPHTMTSVERLAALISAVYYVAHNGIQGSFVECGVWRGGSVIAMIKALQQSASEDRSVYLFDTFQGMSPPTEKDMSYKGEPAALLFHQTLRDDGSSDWCRAELDDVTRRVLATGYRSDLIHFVKGPVEHMLPAEAPDQIALLRLDTDWYESTRHELQHLFPRLVAGGVLIIDDYGYWQGARKAVDEYIQLNNIPLYLARIDSSGRIGIKWFSDGRF
jgi:hypothetical protein